MRRNNKKGFTLAELLIVIAIIAILAAILFPVFGAQLKKAKAAAALATVRANYSEAVADAMLGAEDELTYLADSVTIQATDIVRGLDDKEIIVKYFKTSSSDGKIVVKYDSIEASFVVDKDVTIQGGSSVTDSSGSYTKLY